jgi:hypothetical protein
MALHGFIDKGVSMARLMTALAILGIVAAAYFAYRYGVF